MHVPKHPSEPGCKPIHTALDPKPLTSKTAILWTKTFTTLLEMVVSRSNKCHLVENRAPDNFDLNRFLNISHPEPQNGRQTQKTFTNPLKTHFFRLTCIRLGGKQDFNATLTEKLFQNSP